MNFFKTIQDSIYSQKFYSTLLKKSFKQSVRYFLLLVLLLTVIRTIFLINPLLIEAPKQLQKFAQDTINCFPKDLEVRISNGQAGINAKEPYFIASCEDSNSQNIAVIDTKTFSTEKFNEYKVAAWITKDSVVYKKNNLETNTYSLAQIRDFTLNKEVINSFYKTLSPYLKFVGPILLLFSFLGLYLAYDLRLIQLLLLASLIWVLGKLFKRVLTYSQSYKLGLHAITLGLIVDLVISLTSRWTNFYGFPFMVSILTLGVVTINLFLPKKHPNLDL